MTPDPFTAKGDVLHVKLRVGGTAPIDALTADLAAFVRRLTLLGELVDSAVDGDLGGLKDFIQIGPDVSVATATGEAVVSLKLSDRGLRLHAALRAGNVELDVIEGELRHLMAPVENLPAGGESGAASSPVASHE